MKKKTRKQRERSKNVVKSASKYMRIGKKKLQKVIVLFGQARIDIKIVEATKDVQLEGKASKKTEEQIVKDVERNKQFIEHEGQMKRDKAYQMYRRKELFQIAAKKETELAEDDYLKWKKLTVEFDLLDEEGQVSGPTCVGSVHNFSTPKTYSVFLFLWSLTIFFFAGA